MPLLSYLDIRYYLYFIYFIVVIMIAFGIPGFLVFRKEYLSGFQKVILSLLTGMVLWAYLAFIFNLLHVVWLTYVYLLTCLVLFVLFIKKKKFHVTGYKKKSFSYVKSHKVILTILLLGTIAQYSSIWSMGIMTKEGLTFCCRSVPDNLFHLAVTQSLLLSFPPQEPGMAGTLIHNYYFAAHLIIAELVSIFHLPLITIQANFIPLYLSLLISCSLLVLSQRLKLSNLTTAWLLFFFYFHSDMFYLFTVINKHIWDPTIKMLDNGSELLAAPPLAFGMLFFLATILFVQTWMIHKNIKSGLLVALTVALLVATKIYIAIFAFIGFISVTVYLLFKDKKISIAIPLLISIFLSLCFYLPLNTSAGGLFYSGFWRVTDFAAQPVTGLLKIVVALQVYQAHHNILRIVFILCMFTVLYFITVFGSLLIACIQSKKSLSSYPLWLHIFLLPSILVTLLLSLITLQKTGGANTIQFIIFLLYVSSFYAAIAMTWLLKKVPRQLGFLLVLFVIVLSFPQLMSNVILNFAPTSQKDILTVSNSSLTALNILRASTNNNELIAVDANYLKDTDYYIPLLLGRRMYLTGTGILTDHGGDDKKRVQVLQQLPASLNTLKEQHLHYILVKNTQSALLPSQQIFYKDDELIIYKLK